MTVKTERINLIFFVRIVRSSTASLDNQSRNEAQTL